MRALIIGFGGGTWLLQRQSALPETHALCWFGVIAATALVASVILRRLCKRNVSTWASLGSFVLAFGCGVGAGFDYAALFAEHRLADVLPSAWEGVDIRIQGIVSGLPALNRSDRSVRFVFDVERVVSPDDAIVPKRVSLAWYSGWRGTRPSKATDELPPPEVHAGERWEIAVRLRRPHGNANPHGFDLEAWMLENGLRASGYVRPDGSRRIDAFAGRWIDRIDALRENIRTRILKALDGEPYAGVIVALTIGDQRSVPQDQWQLYNRTGVSHLLSISGLHVTLFATLAGGALYWLWRRSHRLTTLLAARKAAALFGAIAAFCYVLLAGFEVPAQRTLYMLTVAAIGLWIGRPGTAFTVLSWALFVVLLLDPWAVLAAGFWLSFGAVALLMYVGVGRVRLAEGHWLANAAQAQWAITVGMVPLMLALFQQVSLISPFANALAIPLVSMVVVPLALAWLVLPLDVLLHIAHQLFAWLMVVLEWLNALPAAVWSQHAPPSWAVAAGIAGVLLLLAPRGLHLRPLGAIFVVPLFAVMPERPARGALWLEVLDVGQGLAIVVQTQNHTLLYDTGPRFNDLADAGNRIIAPYLRAQGIRELDGIIVTHADTDHSGGVLSLVSMVPVSWVASSMSERSTVVAALQSAERKHSACLAGDGWIWDDVRFEMLHPAGYGDPNAKPKTNDLSCVLRIDSAHGSVLLTGDIEARSEAELIARAAGRLRSDVMLVPHHGSKTSSTPAFLAAVQPSIAMATTGYRNRLGHPKPEVVARYREIGATFLRSDFDGAVRIRFDGGPPDIRKWREFDQRYWRDRPERESSVPD